jgi:hypothetical protein
MAARGKAATIKNAPPSDLQSASRVAAIPTPQQFLLFALFFVALMLAHAPLLRLPYFWDEAGYYVPAARDLYLKGALVPVSTPSSLHPPLVMAWLALAWRVAGYSILVTRTAMLMLAAFSLLGLFRLSRAASNARVAWATTLLVTLYPVFFTQSSLAQVDLPAAGFTFWALLAFLEDHPWKQVLWFSLATLAKETAIVAPLALFVWQFAWQVIAPTVRKRWPSKRFSEFAPPENRRTRAFHLLLPALALAGWFSFHYAKTGHVFGSPDFFRYNVAETLNPLRIPLAFVLRLWQVCGYLGLYLLTLAGALALLRPARIENGHARPRIAIWQQGAFAAVLLAYLVFMSAVGGAVLARYLLPVLPLVILAWVSTLWRRVRHWEVIVGAVGIAFVIGLFVNPPYGFSLEDNLAYRDYVVLHAEASRFLALTQLASTQRATTELATSDPVLPDQNGRVLTAWPASDELTRPWLGYVSRPFPVLRLEDFTAAQIALASAARGRFSVALVFSTKYQPAHPLLEDWQAWQRLKEKFFGYHRDMSAEEIAQGLGGRIVFQKKAAGQWVAVIAFDQKPE